MSGAAGEAHDQWKGKAMVFERNIGGFQVMLRIDGYRKPAEDDEFNVWCDCGYAFRFRDVIDYHCAHDELFMPWEVDALEAALTALLDGRIKEPCKVTLTEPDFVFALFPEKDLRDDPHVCVAPGHEIRDIYVEWRVYFWDEGLTQNFLTLTLGRSDIIAFRDFLARCKGAEGDC